MFCFKHYDSIITLCFLKSIDIGEDEEVMELWKREHDLYTKSQTELSAFVRNGTEHALFFSFLCRVLPENSFKKGRHYPLCDLWKLCRVCEINTYFDNNELVYGETYAIFANPREGNVLQSILSNTI